MRIGVLLALVLICLLRMGAAHASDSRLASHVGQVRLGELNAILKARYLRVLTIKNPYDYYVHKGEMKGVQYEMVREFVAHLNRKYAKKKRELKIAFELIPVDFDQLIPMLTEGRGDLVAVGLTRTPERDAEVEFTLPYQVVRDVIVTRKELAKESWKGKTFLVQADSSYLRAIEESGEDVDVRAVDANLNAENVMEMVSLKGADYTLVNSYWAERIGRRFKNLTMLDDQPFRKEVEVGWAVRKGSPELLKELNAFIPKVRKGTLLGNTFGQKYFDNLSRLHRDFDLAAQKISNYDASIKKYAKQYGFDWRLLAALCLEESQFRQEIDNKFGAVGLFQIKQSTADEPYVSVGPIRGKANADNNIHAGVKYLAWLKKSFFDSEDQLSEDERLRMMLAAYNAGPARVQEAIGKARRMGLNPHVWFRNVEVAMLSLGVPETVLYVSEINKHYVSYLLLGIK
ncbi:MAG TPA: transporter substrate-binding domain-containing protein [Bdellovibrionota bacterium]|nr:transporter substrate-binding domain-containing protein [Bdellovibrionota bacterium]